MDPRIVWITSFSKSGNTWVRQVLSRHLLGDQWHPNRVASAVPHFCVHNQITVPFVQQLTRPMIAELAAKWLPIQTEVCERLRAAGPQIIVYKTHNVAAQVEGHLFTNAQVTKSVVQIIRDPRDVVVSLAHHYNCDIDNAFHFLTDDRYFPVIVFPTDDPDKPFVTSEFYSSWKMHYTSWSKFDQAPKLQLRYEDIKADPRTHYRRMIEFIGMPVTDAQLDGLVHDTAFKNLQAIEAKEGFSEGFPDRPFFRRGEAGGWRDHPRQDIMRRIEELYVEPMTELGYL